MKIAVLGAGAMGTLFSALFTKAGYKTWLYTKNRESAQIINKQGICTEKNTDTSYIKNITAVTLPQDIPSPDILFIFVKSTETQTALADIKKIIKPHTIVVTLQNGLGNIEKIQTIVKQQNIVAGTTAHGATLLAPAKVRHAGIGQTVIGSINETVNSAVNAAEEILNKSLIETSVSDNIIGVIWDKLLVNVGINALTAITGLKNGRIMEFQETEEILEAAVNEAFAVAKQLGIKLNYQDPVEHTKQVCRLTAANTSSMLQDILRKRKTEIQMINGAVVDQARKLGIKTPVNLVLSDIVSVIQRTYCKKS